VKSTAPKMIIRGGTTNDSMNTETAFAALHRALRSAGEARLELAERAAPTTGSRSVAEGPIGRAHQHLDPMPYHRRRSPARTGSDAPHRG
jgi:hypothetical protein